MGASDALSTGAPLSGPGELSTAVPLSIPDALSTAAPLSTPVMLSTAVPLSAIAALSFAPPASVAPVTLGSVPTHAATASDKARAKSVRAWSAPSILGIVTFLKGPLRCRAQVTTRS